MEEFKALYKSPLGIIEIIANNDGIIAAEFQEDNYKIKANPNLHTQICEHQLDEYFAGQRKEFNLLLDPQGTDFRKTVWNKLLAIPFGRTTSYRDIAFQLGDTNAVRAVGNANGKNKISIIIPCHRVIGLSGNMVGYAGGLWRKKRLLNHEYKIHSDTQQGLLF
jgi:methylated-DNA-[protein]-cysteine S-methyltransferase